MLAAVLLVSSGCGVLAAPPRSPGGTPRATAPSAPTPAAASATAAATPLPTAAPPSPSPRPQLTSKFGFSAKGMSHEVIAFVNHGHLDAELPKLDYSAVSTIAYFSISVDARGRLIRNRVDWTRWMGRSMDKLIARAHAAGTKVVPSLRQFAWTSGGAKETTAWLSNAVYRKRAVREIAQAVRDRGADGLNIDVEPVPRGQSANFVRFVREMRAALDVIDRNYQLTVCTTGHIANYDIRALAKLGAADAIYIMGYHYRGPWSKIAGSVAPINGPMYNYAATLKTYLGRAAAKKIILGVPLYGWSWLTETAGVRSRVTGGSRALFYKDAIAQARTRAFRYDTAEQVAWTAFRSGSGWRQMYFDNLRAIEAKWGFVKRNRLLGTGLWALGFEGGGSAGIFALLRKSFLVAPGTTRD